MQIKGYNTKQKNIIVDMLKKNKNRHLTADEMLKILDEMDSPVSKATLYRFLDVLVSTGDLRKYITLEGEKACYQYIDEEATEDEQKIASEIEESKKKKKRFNAKDFLMMN